MKKFFLLLFFLLFIDFSWHLYKYFNPKQNLGNGYYYIDMGYDSWQSINNLKGEVVPQKVVEFDYDNKYIIAIRIVVDLYECYKKNTKYFNSKNSVALPVVYRKKIEYWLVDKKKNIAYVSENKSFILKKLKSFNSRLSFSKNDFSNYVEMQIKSGLLNKNYNCLLTNNPEKNGVLKKVYYIKNRP